MPVLAQPTLTVIIPTIGRTTLPRTLESIDTQDTTPGDQTLVIFDDPPHDDWGAWARTQGMRKARGDFLLFMDDDDEYLPGAFDAVRASVRRAPDRAHIFRMVRAHPFGDVIWTRKNLARPGQVSTQMIVVPNDRNRMGTWTNRYEGDFDFLTSTLALLGSEPVWCDAVIAKQYPHPHGRH